MPDDEITRATRICRVPMARIEEVVSAHLGPGRVRGNESVPCFSRQVSMYLAHHVGGWSTTRIGRFYNGRHHTTVLHAIAKIERRRIQDEALDALLELLIGALTQEIKARPALPKTVNWRDQIVSAVAGRILQSLEERSELERHNARVALDLPPNLLDLIAEAAKRRGATVEQVIVEILSREVESRSRADQSWFRTGISNRFWPGSSGECA